MRDGCEGASRILPLLAPVVRSIHLSPDDEYIVINLSEYHLPRPQDKDELVFIDLWDLKLPAALPPA